MNVRRLAVRLMEHAAAVMPAEWREWAEAMAAEFDVLPTDREALAWAAGCVLASYRERIKSMGVFLKLSLRAVAEGMVVAAFILGWMLLSPWWGGDTYGGGLLVVLLMFSGGIFATLWILELVIARFWMAPGKPFQKTLLRAAVLWLWPMGFNLSVVIGAVWSNPFLRAGGNAHVHIDFARFFASYVLHTLIASAGHFAVYFVAIFVPLLICELAIVRYGRGIARRRGDAATFEGHAPRL